MISNASKKKWLTLDGLMNITAIAEPPRPRPIAANCATYAGGF
jgi:hypothetical protein